MSEMIFYFNTEGDTLSMIGVKDTVFTGNAGVYKCSFELNEDWRRLCAVAIFSQDDKSYTALLSDAGECYIPYEILENEGSFSVGLVGTNSDEQNLKRISTNCVEIPIAHGAYRPGEVPSIPSPDMWETLIDRTVAKIGINGHWYIWNPEKREFRDSGHVAVAAFDNELDQYSENAVKNGVIFTALLEKEDSENKVFTISAESTDLQYPSARAVWNAIGNVEDALDGIITLQNIYIGGESS